MLPEIIKVAEEYGLTFNSRTHGKKETLCKCTFCEEDSKPGKGHKYYLSLNSHDQVYKCWYCGVSGGVLDFESKLSGLPYKEVREKYFGKKKKNTHPAESLNARQLRLIGWAEYVKDDDKRVSWAKEGTEIGRGAWKASLSTCDFDMDKVVYNVVLLYHMLKIDKKRLPVKESHKKKAIADDKMSFAN